MKKILFSLFFITSILWIIFIVFLNEFRSGEVEIWVLDQDNWFTEIESLSTESSLQTDYAKLPENSANWLQSEMLENFIDGMQDVQNWREIK